MDQNPKDKMPHFLLKTHNCTDAEERKVMYAVQVERLRSFGSGCIYL